jgi:hypothetical protein
VIARIEQSIGLLESFPKLGRAGAVKNTRELVIPRIIGSFTGKSKK